jgi:hypothetical protein
MMPNATLCFPPFSTLFVHPAIFAIPAIFGTRNTAFPPFSSAPATTDRHRPPTHSHHNKSKSVTMNLEDEGMNYY